MPAARTNAARTASISPRVISRGVWLCGKYGSGEAEISGQLPSSSGSSMPSHSFRVEPLRPAWASCRPIFAGLAPCTKSTMRFHAVTCSGLYIPVQPGLMRPSRLTSVISVITSAAPPTARLQAERELRRLQPPVVALGVLEPLEARLGRPLQRLDLRPPLGFVGGQRASHVAMLAKRLRQRDGVFYRELGTGADREVGGVGGVADEDDVVVVPAGVAHGREAAPERAVLE